MEAGLCFILPGEEVINEYIRQVLEYVQDN